MKVYNTLTRQTEELKPISNNSISIYSCGPTVYDYAHIGNLSAFLFADLLKRTLRYLGYTVKHVMNITDVDDKIIRDSQAQHMSQDEFVKKYIDAFYEDLRRLHIEPADKYPCATKHIRKMQEIIQTLADKGLAYLGTDGSIYYSVRNFKHYGQLARIDPKALKEGASGRVKQDEYTKEQVHDFALWKAYDPIDGTTFWHLDVTIDGKQHSIKGRPGWHIECSAMSTEYLGNHFDIHTGGIDLVFPHHDNEIAQSEGATDEKFVNYWMHNEHLLVDGKKMSKSEGNFYTLRDLLHKDYSPLAFRYLILSTHYRTKQNFTFEALDSAGHSIERLQEFVNRLRDAQEFASASQESGVVATAEKKFRTALENDIDMPAALEALFGLVKETYNQLDHLGKNDIHAALEFMKQANNILGILNFEREELPTIVAELITQRERARDVKDWNLSDKLRDQILEHGYTIKDTPHGTRWSKTNL